LQESRSFLAHLCFENPLELTIANNYVETLSVPLGPASQAEREERFEKYCEEAGTAVAKEKFSCGYARPRVPKTLANCAAATV